jgi:hypothetical protein
MRPTDFTLSIQSFTVWQAVSRKSPTPGFVFCAFSKARYHNNRSKLLDTRISIAGESVSTTPPIADGESGMRLESTFSYRPVLQKRVRMSLALVAMTSLPIGKPMRLA